jgi:hypothetical protein
MRQGDQLFNDWYTQTWSLGAIQGFRRLLQNVVEKKRLE